MKRKNVQAILVIGIVVATLQLIQQPIPSTETALISPLPREQQKHRHQQKSLFRQDEASNQILSHLANEPKKSKSPVAFVISISSCADKKGEPNVLDGAAVLGWSVRKHSKKYGYHLYAFVHTSAQECVEDLKVVGYDVRVVGLPFAVEELQEDLQSSIGEAESCCGDKEFLKLYAYTLTDHRLVIHLDVDTLLLQPMDDLLDYLLSGSTNVSLPIIGSNTTTPPSSGSQVDFLFTREYKTANMIEPFNKSKYGIQGGFFILRPNATWFREMLSHLKSAHYTRASGWDLMGYGGYWGSAQVQGFLSWVYPEHYYDSSRFVELNPCIYNTLAMDFSRFSITQCNQNQDVCGKCRTVDCLNCAVTPIKDLKIVHFSTCFKPWKCPRFLHPTRVKCKQMHPIWYRYRQEMEISMGIDLPSNATAWRIEVTRGYCRSTGEFRNTYLPMNVTNVAKPLLPF